MEMGKGETHTYYMFVPLPGLYKLICMEHPTPLSPPHLIPTPPSDYSTGHFPKSRVDCFAGHAHWSKSCPLYILCFAIIYLVLRLFDGGLTPRGPLTSRNARTMVIPLTNAALEDSTLPGTQLIPNEYNMDKSTNPFLPRNANTFSKFFE